MSSYLFKMVFTPDDITKDRSREKFLVTEAHNPSYAIAIAATHLGLKQWVTQIQTMYLTASGIESHSGDVAFRIPNPFHWVMPTLSPQGSYGFSIEKVEVEEADPVSASAILAWAIGEAEKETKEFHDHRPAVREILRGVLGRWSWRNVDNLGESELKLSLFNFLTQGYDFKPTRPFSEMDGQDLAAVIMEQVVEHLKEVYEIQMEGFGDTSIVPFGMSVMLKNDPWLWFDRLKNDPG